MNWLKRIFTTGLIVFFAVCVLAFFVKLIIDFLASLFGPLILAWLGKEYWIIPLTILFTFIIIIIVGFLFSHLGFRAIIKKILERILPKGECGALVERNPGVYDLAIIITKIKLKRLTGKIKNQYVLYAPYSPMPWSGLPVIFANEEKVIPLKMTLQEVYSTIASFGKNAPKLLEELKGKSID